MIKSSFFNSLGGDRTYNADSLAERFKLFFSDGVFYYKSTSLQVVADSGLKVNILTGACNIEGYCAEVTSAESLELDTPDSLNPRMDAICICLDKSERLFRTEIVKGIPSAIPSAPFISNTDTKKYLCLAYVLVGAQAQAIYNSDINDKRLDTALCGIVTQAVQSFDTSTFYNQMESSLRDFLSTSEQTFLDWFETIKAQLSTISVGQFENRLVALENEKARQFEYIYTDTTGNANQKISQIVNNFLSGSATDEKMLSLSIQLDVFPSGGSVESSGSLPVSFMRFGTSSATNRRVIIDFTNCPKLSGSLPIVANSNVTIKGLRYSTTSGDALISYGARIEKCLLTGGQNGITGTLIYADDCKIEALGLNTSQNASGVNCGGSLRNCDIVAKQESASGMGTGSGAFGVRIDSGAYPLLIQGGSCRGYVKSGATTSEAVGLYVAGSLTEAVINAYGVRFPQVARSGFVQTNPIKINSGFGSVIGCMSYKDNAIYSASNIFSGGNSQINKTFGLN